MAFIKKEIHIHKGCCPDRSEAAKGGGWIILVGGAALVWIVYALVHGWATSPGYENFETVATVSSSGGAASGGLHIVTRVFLSVTAILGGSLVLFGFGASLYHKIKDRRGAAKEKAATAKILPERRSFLLLPEKSSAADLGEWNGARVEIEKTNEKIHSVLN